MVTKQFGKTKKVLGRAGVFPQIKSKTRKSVRYGVVEVCERAPVDMGGWVLTIMHINILTKKEVLLIQMSHGRHRSAP